MTDIQKTAKISFWVYATLPIIVITAIGIYILYKQKYLLGAVILIVGLGYFYLRYKKIQMEFNKK